MDERQHGFTTRQGVPFLLVASHKGVQRVGGVIEHKAGCVGCPATAIRERNGG